MAESLYRKWRSRGFFEVVGQDHVTQTLRNAVRTNSVGHAYLFTGPRGTGKTSSARILARAVNCLNPHDGEPCNECEPCRAMLANRCLDLIEIDAASRSKVDEMRELLEKVGYAATEVKRKVYIVDEVHMLSGHAFNALLKTLEEPPAHVSFVLATTDADKVPVTIVSRCQRLDFRTISPHDITTRLAYVCKQEGIEIDAQALELLAQHATGSLRDALSLLDQVRAYEGAMIGLRQVEDALGLVRHETLADLTDAIISGDVGGALALITELADAGADMRQYAKQLVQYWRDLLLLTVQAPKALDHQPDVRKVEQAHSLTSEHVIEMLKVLLQPDYSGRRSASAQWQLELAVVEAAQPFMGSGRSAPPRPPAVAPASAPRTPESVRQAPAARLQEAPAAGASTVDAAPDSPQQAEPAATVALEPVEAADAAPSPNGATAATPEPTMAPSPVVNETRTPSDIWSEVLQMLSREGNAPIIGKLKGCQPLELKGDTFAVQIKTAFERDRVEAPKTREAIEAVLARVLGRAVSLRCVTIGAASAGSGGATSVPQETFKSSLERALRGVHIERQTP